MKLYLKVFPCQKTLFRHPDEKMVTGIFIYRKKVIRKATMRAKSRGYK